MTPSSGASNPLFQLPGGVVRGTDTAYDPVHNIYLVVGGQGAVQGMFVSASGASLGGAFSIASGAPPSYFPRVKYSSEANAGNGGFLVTWHEEGGPNGAVGVHDAVVAYPNGVIVADTLISDFSPAGTNVEHGCAAAYSTTSHRWLVVWTTVLWQVQGRFVDVGGKPIGSVFLIDGSGGSGAFDPSVTWNPSTNQFGISMVGFPSSGAPYARFKRYAADGTFLAQNTFGSAVGTFSSGIDFNTISNTFVMTWYSQGSGMQSAGFDSAGNATGSALVSSRMVGTDNGAIAFNPFSRTFLVVGHDSLTSDALGAELNGNGVVDSGAINVTGGGTTGSFYPRAAGNSSASNWNVVYSLNFKFVTDQIVGTSSSNGGSAATFSNPGGGSGGGTPPPPPPPPPPGGCSTPDPFTAIGGGTCVNGGWIPSGSTGGSSGGGTGCATASPGTGWTCVNGGWIPPTGTGGSTGSSGCSTPDPFVSIGGGTCVNGGWIPGTSGGSSGGSSTGCATASPGAGWTCVNGGWIPPTGTGGSTGGTGCSTPDPFASIGGGTCVNGGWIPGTSGGSTGGCSTPDPFAAIGGGTCVNGGWIPGTSGGSSGGTGCATVQPGPGWTCVNGGWLPPTSPSTGCATSDPFTSIGGGTCVNGGWIPKGMAGLPAPEPVPGPDSLSAMAVTPAPVFAEAAAAPVPLRA